MIKAIFFDIDGTLVSFKTHTVPGSAIRALSALREKGIKTIIATGRHIQAVNNLGTLEFDGYITLNGGFCTLGKKQVVYKHAIPTADVDALIRYQEQQGAFPCIVLQEQDMYINFVTPEVETLMKHIDLPPLPMKPLPEFAGKEIFQLVSFFSGNQEREAMAVMPNCQATRWYPLFADVVPAESSKSVGMDRILDHLHIRPDECMAFGDGGNDISMLRHAGIGVALGNADAHVQAAADYVTDDVDDDGIYNALKHFGVI